MLDRRRALPNRVRRGAFLCCVWRVVGQHAAKLYQRKSLSIQAWTLVTKQHGQAEVAPNQQRYDDIYWEQDQNAQAGDHNVKNTFAPRHQLALFISSGLLR